MIVFGPNKTAIRWFQICDDWLFDMLKIPGDEHGRIVREMARVMARVMIPMHLNHERLPLSDGREGPLLRWDHFSDEVREALRTMKYKRPPGTNSRSVENLKSFDCHRRIWGFCISMCYGYAAWKCENSMVTSSIAPAMELVQTCVQEETENWPYLWHEAGGKFYGERMIARKTDEVWQKLSRFGVPWGPFAIGSGMRTRNIPRKEALALKVIKRGDRQEPVTGWWDVAEEV